MSRVTVSRRELYRQVWSTAMTRLAKKYGLSDVGLAKICRKHDVPRPARGYWAKKQYGKAVDALEAARRLTQKPNNELMIALGDLYVTMELPKTAWKCYSAVPKAASERLAALGRQFVHDGDIESAMAIAETLKKSPKHTGEADLLTGLCELSRKRYPQAEAALRLALKTDPGNGGPATRRRRRDTRCRVGKRASMDRGEPIAQEWLTYS